MKLEITMAILIYFCMIPITVFWLEDNWPEGGDMNQAIAGICWPIAGLFVAAGCIVIGIIMLATVALDLFVKGRNKFIHWIMGTEQE